MFKVCDRKAMQEIIEQGFTSFRCSMEHIFIINNFARINKGSGAGSSTETQGMGHHATARLKLTKQLEMKTSCEISQKL